MLPNALIVGAIKSGTTTLAELLRQHPEVFVSRPKELHFFSHEENFAKGLTWYESHFEGAEQCKAILEATPNYSATRTYPQALERIAEDLPDVRLVYIVRHPVERVLSHWSFFYAKGRDVPPIDKAVRADPLYLDVSRYAEHTRKMRERFGDDRVHVMFLDDFKADPHVEMARLCEYLGVDSTFRFVDVDIPRNSMAAAGMFRWGLKHIPGFVAAKNKVPLRARARLKRSVLKKIQKPAMPEETQRWLADQLRDDAEAFLEAHGKPVDYWKLS